ncbi:MAG: DMT family transporter [Bacteroidales bacterium]|nr:DMT family transporter [Bacteroidales bacterium]
MLPREEKNVHTLILLHLAVFLAGWTGIFGRLITLSGLPLVWYRMFVSVVTLTLALLAMRRLHLPKGKDLARICGCGCILASHWVAFYASIQASNVSVGVACIATTSFFTALLNIFFNRKEASWKEFVISFISIVGVLLIFSLDVRYRLGIALGLLCSLLYAVFSLLHIRTSINTGHDSATMLLYELVGGLLFLSLCTPIFHRLMPGIPIVPTRTDTVWLLLLGSIFTILPFLLQLHALTRLSAFTVNLAYNLEPVYSIAFAAILFGELQELDWSFWLGITLIVTSVAIQTIRVKRRT